MASLDIRSIKRQKLALSSLALAIALAVALQWPFGGLALPAIWLINFGLLIWALDFDLKKEEWLVLPLYALVLTTIAFLFLDWYGQLAWLHWSGVVVYGLAMYGLLLTLNILNVATVRPLPLTRQALSVMSLAGIAGLFAAFYLLVATLPNMLEWVGGTMVLTFLIAWPLVWSGRLGQASTANYKADLGWTLLIVLIAGELAAAVGFWPISFMTSLLMAGGLSMAIGLVHYQQNRQVTKAMQLQYLTIGAIMAVVYYLVSQWV
jgi:hypothetical protein